MKPIEETRKIQLTGRSTYIVSLPKKWIKGMKLNVGDQLILRRQGNSTILITPRSKGFNKREVTLRVSPEENPYALVRKIISFYLVGYNTIVLTAGTKRISTEQRRAVKEIIRRKLIGTEIITDSPNEMSLRILLSYPELSIKNALERMYSLARSMHKDALTALFKLDYTLARSVIELDDEVDRFNLYIIRQLKSAIQNAYEIKAMGLNTPRDCLGYRLITKSIERIADHAARIAESVLAFKKPPKAEFLEVVKKMYSFADSTLNDSVTALLTQNYELAERVLENYKKINSLEGSAVVHILKQSFTMEEIANLRLILESVRRVSEYASDIAEVVLNLTVEQFAQD